MIIKILSSASREFHGVKYNDKKVNNGIGELMEMKNFPSFINQDSKLEVVRDYLKSISNNGRVTKPQFHAVISTKYQEHSKEELTKIANEVMKEMGYGKQPYIIAFHNDTDNNHVHIVSSRVDKLTGKKINDSFERLKSQKALNNALEKIYKKKVDRDLSLLLQYNYNSSKQLETLLKREGFKLVPNKDDETKVDVVKNGYKEKTLNLNELKFSDENKQRKKQLKAIFYKYKEKYSGKVFRVVDDREQKEKEQEQKSNNAEIKIDFASELQHNFRKLFGVDIVFHTKDDKDPFGYTVIDHKTGGVFKGSEIMKMKELFEFTDEKIDKRTFEKLKEFNVSNKETKKSLQNYLGKDVKDFMIFENRTKKKLDDYKALKNDVIDFINKNVRNENISILQSDEGNFYAVHSKYNHIQELQSLVGKDIYNEFINPNNNEDSIEYNKGNSENVTDILDDFMRDLSRSEFTKSDPDEIGKKKRKKKKR